MPKTADTSRRRDWQTKASCSRRNFRARELKWRGVFRPSSPRHFFSSAGAPALLPSSANKGLPCCPVPIYRQGGKRHRQLGDVGGALFSRRAFRSSAPVARCVSALPHTARTPTLVVHAGRRGALNAMR